MAKPTLSAATKLLKGSKFSQVADGVAMLLAMGDPAVFDKVIAGVGVGLEAGGMFNTTKNNRAIRAHAIRAVVAAAPRGTHAAALRDATDELRIDGAGQSVSSTITYNNKPLDLTPLTAFNKLKSVTVRGASELHGQGALVGLALEELYLWNVQKLTAIDKLGRHPKVRVLQLRDCHGLLKVDLRGFPALETLWLHDANRLKSLTGLDGRIRTVSMARTDLLPPLPLKKMTGLRELDIQQQKRRLVAELGALRKLERLRLVELDPPIATLADLPPLPELVWLEVSGDFPTLDGIERYPKLRDLDAQWKLTDLSAVTKLPRLESFTTRPCDLSPLMGCKRLKRLRIEEGEADLTPLAKHPTLEEITFNYQKMMDKSTIPPSLRAKTRYRRWKPGRDPD